MENDYLWDKTGEDKEIERMEMALQSLRYQPTAPPPVIPFAIGHTEKKSRFVFFNNYFKMAFAGFACLALLFFVWGIYSNIFIPRLQPVTQAAAIPEPFLKLQLKNKPDEFIPIIKPPTFIKRSVENSSPANDKPDKINYRAAAPKARKNKKVYLTAEERNAYEQLMLALSITGEKLKEVKDKANSVAETNTIKSLR